MSHDDDFDVGGSSSENIVKILDYVGAHPRAKDTISGIEKWWLAANLSLEGKRKLEGELNLLVSKGWLNARNSAQSETVYSLNEPKLPEIKEFLKRRS